MSVTIFGITVSIAKAHVPEQKQEKTWYPGNEHNTIDEWYESAREKAYRWSNLPLA